MTRRRKVQQWEVDEAEQGRLEVKKIAEELAKLGDHYGRTTTVRS